MSDLEHRRRHNTCLSSLVISGTMGITVFLCGCLITPSETYRLAFMGGLGLILHFGLLAGVVALACYFATLGVLRSRRLDHVGELQRFLLAGLLAGGLGLGAILWGVQDMIRNPLPAWCGSLGSLLPPVHLFVSGARLSSCGTARPNPAASVDGGIPFRLKPTALGPPPLGSIYKRSHAAETIDSIGDLSLLGKNVSGVVSGKITISCEFGNIIKRNKNVSLSLNDKVGK